MQLNRVIMMAGGTGGHVFPALAIAKELEKRGTKILWLGTKGRMEEILVPKHGFDIKYIDVQGIRRNGLIRKLKAPFMVLHAIMQARAIFKEFKPDLVMGMGGYASGPGGLCAFLMRIPLVLHEQNAAAGLTNKLLSKFAKVIFLGFPGAFKGYKVEVVGNPVRESILALHNKQKDFTSKINILIVGGSLGARALNDEVPTILNNLDIDSNLISVTHQTGKDNSEKTYKLYRQDKFDVKVVDFIDNMDEALDKAHLIICRAGALTCAEVICCNLPAIFVPLPTAVDDHQTYNAMTFVKEGAALIVAQKDLKEKLSDTIKDLVLNKEKLSAMSKKCFDVATIDATHKVIDRLERL